MNITRCFNCPGYGHIAKVCSTPDQLCSVYGSKDHLRNDSHKKIHPECVKCRDCPEYQRQCELYNKSIQW